MNNGGENRYGEVVEQFNHKAHSYDELHLAADSIMGLNQRLRNHWLAELVDGKGRMLEVGCGTGINLKNLPHRRGSVGIDISTDMLKICRHKNLDVCRANGEILPFKDESFDYVLCINALQYFDNLPMMMLEIKRVLKKEGRFIFDFKNRISVRAAVHYLAQVFRKERDEDLENRHSVFVIKKILQKLGWEIERMIGMEFHFFSVNVNPTDKKLIESIFKREKYLSSTMLMYLAGRIMLSVIHSVNSEG